jgi:hypothetical protein
MTRQYDSAVLPILIKLWGAGIVGKIENLPTSSHPCACRTPRR